jgi:hypothetical protein
MIKPDNSLKIQFSQLRMLHIDFLELQVACTFKRIPGKLQQFVGNIVGNGKTEMTLTYPDQQYLLGSIVVSLESDIKNLFHV